jgi:hypothetical protein
MTLPTLHFSRRDPVSLPGSSGGTVEGILAEIRAALLAEGWTVADQDAGSPSRLVAIAATPPEPALSDCRIVFGGDDEDSPTGAQFYPSNVTAAAKALFVGLCREVPSAASFGDWTDGNPFAGSRFTGYIGWGNLADHAHSALLRLYISAESIRGTLGDGGTNNRALFVGAELDPLSDHPSDTEPSGRKFLLNAHGRALTFTNNPWQSGNGSFFMHGPSANQQICIVPRPGADNLDVMQVLLSSVAITSPNRFRTPSGNSIKLPIAIHRLDRWGGILRNGWMCPNAQNGQIITRQQGPGTATEGFVISYSDDAQHHALLVGA